MIVQEILTAQFDPESELDRILAKCCELVLNGQQQDADYYGMVGACVIGPEGQQVCRTSYKDGDKYIHAERAAIEAYGNITPECIIVTTLSPCNSPMDDRAGESCEDLLAEYGIEHVYCGYKDPTQDGDDSIETKNSKLQQLCKQLADTFLDEDYDPNGPPPGPEFKPTMPAGTVRVDVSDVYDWYKLGQHISNLDGLGKHDFGAGPPSTIFSFGSEELEHKFIDALKKTGLTTTDIDPVDPKQPAGMPRQKTDPTYNVAETLEETPPKVLRALDQAAQKNGYRNWADVKANPRSESAVMTVARLANTILRTAGPHHEKVFYKNKTDENFADGKVKGKSRPGRVKRAGASCKGSVTSLRSKAKNSSGERAKMYHWCANMKSGRKK